ncbi:MAG: ABC transporter ATP-binding protein [Chloroflexota bacterium]
MQDSANHDNREVVLQVEGITKRFPGILANDHINLTLHRGEILALLGENGAGKSTLMNIIYGLYRADEGTIRVKGQEVHFASPREAIRTGIGMVHQHFQLIPVMSVAENVILGEEETVSGSDETIRKPPEDTGVAGAIRVLWGILWRLLIPVVAIVIGLLVAQLGLLLVLTASTYLAPTDPFASTSVYDSAIVALADVYLAHTTIVTVLLWLPAVLGAIVGAGLMVLGFRYTKRTWRGTARRAAHPSQIDNIIDGVIDLFATTTSILDRKRADKRVRDLSHQYGLDVEPDAMVEKLPVGTQQRVEIVKALYRHADILILDEPTAVLTPQEVNELFKIMRELTAQGVSIIFITHKLKEVFAVADSIVVMRNGKLAGTALPQEATESSLAEMMVGREVILRIAKTTATPGDIVLAVHDIHAKDDRNAMVVDGVNLEVRAGEVLGVAGVQGNGQTELVEVLTGLRRPTSGDVKVLGTHIGHADPREITLIGTAHVPEDRQRYGMVNTFTVADNLVLNRYYAAPFSTTPTRRGLPIALLGYAALFGAIALLAAQIWVSVLWPALQSALGLAEADPTKNDGQFIIAMLLTIAAVVVVSVIDHLVTTFVLTRLIALSTSRNKPQGGLTIDESAVASNAEQQVHEYDIRTPSIMVNAGNLSGGNQQKMVVAREFSRKPRLLIASQPTRGIDVGSIEFIHHQIIQQRDEGAAVLLVSAELDEILALSDRIAVIYKGHIIDTVDANTATREQLGLLMAGVAPQAAEGVPA